MRLENKIYTYTRTTLCCLPITGSEGNAAKIKEDTIHETISFLGISLCTDFNIKGHKVSTDIRTDKTHLSKNVIT